MTYICRGKFLRCCGCDEMATTAAGLPVVVTTTTTSFRNRSSRKQRATGSSRTRLAVTARELSTKNNAGIDGKSTSIRVGEGNRRQTAASLAVCWMTAMTASVVAGLSDNSNNNREAAAAAAASRAEAMADPIFLANNCETNNDAQQQHGLAFYEFLLEQLRVVTYVEGRDASTITSDSGRNKPSGLVGLSCRHCERLSDDSSGFPQDRRSLARVVSTKLYQHVVACQHCPESTKQTLKALHTKHHQQQQRQQPLLENGTSNKRLVVSREERLFFKDLWYQMGHKDMPGEHEGGRQRPGGTWSPFT